MKRTFFFAALVTVALAAARVPLAQAPRAIEAQLKAAQHKEEVEGDLKGAIEQSRIVRSGDRALEARALIRMAECYRKLGDKESRTIYEQVVRQYSDQHEAVALARRRLNGAPYAAPPRGDRAVWTGPNVATVRTSIAGWPFHNVRRLDRRRPGRSRRRGEYRSRVDHGGRANKVRAVRGAIDDLARWQTGGVFLVQREGSSRTSDQTTARKRTYSKSVHSSRAATRSGSFLPTTGHRTAFGLPSQFNEMTARAK